MVKLIDKKLPKGDLLHIKNKSLTYIITTNVINSASLVPDEKIDEISELFSSIEPLLIDYLNTHFIINLSEDINLYKKSKNNNYQLIDFLEFEDIASSPQYLISSDAYSDTIYDFEYQLKCYNNSKKDKNGRSLDNDYSLEDIYKEYSLENVEFYVVEVTNTFFGLRFNEDFCFSHNHIIGSFEELENMLKSRIYLPGEMNLLHNSETNAEFWLNEGIGLIEEQNYQFIEFPQIRPDL